MTILEIIKAFCKRTGLLPPVSAASSGDDQILQIFELANEILDNLEERKAYTFVQKEATFPAVATTRQIELAVTAPGIISILDGVLFNRTAGTCILGPITPLEWQASAAGIYSISETQFRIQGGHLYLSPVPGLGDTIAFEYNSNFAVFDPTTGVSKQYFTKDTDTTFYPDKLIILGLRWKWKREKGLRYAEDFRDFEYAVANFTGKDMEARAINLAGDGMQLRGIAIPERGWDL